MNIIEKELIINYDFEIMLKKEPLRFVTDNRYKLNSSYKESLNYDSHDPCILINYDKNYYIKD